MKTRYVGALAISLALLVILGAFALANLNEFRMAKVSPTILPDEIRIAQEELRFAQGQQTLTWRVAEIGNGLLWGAYTCTDRLDTPSYFVFWCVTAPDGSISSPIGAGGTPQANTAFQGHVFGTPDVPRAFAVGLSLDRRIASVVGKLSDGTEVHATPVNGFWLLLADAETEAQWVSVEARNDAGRVIRKL